MPGKVGGCEVAAFFQVDADGLEVGEAGADLVPSIECRGVGPDGVALGEEAALFFVVGDEWGPEWRRLANVAGFGVIEVDEELAGWGGGGEIIGQLAGAFFLLGGAHVARALGEREELFTRTGEGPFGRSDSTGLGGGIVGVKGLPGAVENFIDGGGEFGKGVGISLGRGRNGGFIEIARGASGIVDEGRRILCGEMSRDGQTREGDEERASCGHFATVPFRQTMVEPVIHQILSPTMAAAPCAGPFHWMEKCREFSVSATCQWPGFSLLSLSEAMHL